MELPKIQGSLRLKWLPQFPETGGAPRQGNGWWATVLYSVLFGELTFWLLVLVGPQALKEMVGNIALFGTYDATLAALSGTTAKALQASGGHLLQGQSWLAIWPAGSLAGMAYYMV